MQLLEMWSSGERLESKSLSCREDNGEHDKDNVEIIHSETPEVLHSLNKGKFGA